jgi:uncharacterized membrane protein YraQ (UPF0718 family)
MDTPTSSKRTIPRSLLILLIVAVILLTIPSDISLAFLQRAAVSIPDFATIFLGIFIEAAPFLLLGTLASGIVEVFISQDFFARAVSHRAGLGALTGGLMGLAFPVCECGVVPLTRRLLRKGLPLQAGIAFLLAAPVLNPIVIASTAAAFGWGKMLLLRTGLTLLIAVITGLVFSVARSPWEILRPTEWVQGEDLLQLNPQVQAQSLRERWQRVLLIAMDEFFEMGRYLVIGAMLAAAMQIFIPQSIMLAVGQGPFISVIVMVGLAVLLSICSTVDAFVALGFVGTFSPGAILAFLVFGPMVDIKSVLMYGRVFRTRPVLYLILIPLLVSILSGLLVNYYLS